MADFDLRLFSSRQGMGKRLAIVAHSTRSIDGVTAPMKAQLSFSVNSPFTLPPRTTRAADLRVRESAWLGFGDELGRSSSNLSPSTESSHHFSSRGAADLRGSGRIRCLSVAPGTDSCTAATNVPTGPSGGGKTTLIKIMLGLLEPTSGEVLIDGIPLSTIGPRAYREQVGAVMQDDQLLSGSIADNICFFDHSFDQQRMIECACLARIHEEIMAMPMTYNSLIGDMGSSLSGGQKQRVLLARALYRQPRMLFLDEGTAHLDVENEKCINESLKHLNMTRINVAHRPEISSGADHILRVGQTHAAVQQITEVAS